MGSLEETPLAVKLLENRLYIYSIMRLSANIGIDCCITKKYFLVFKISQAYSWLTTAQAVLTPSPFTEISLTIPYTLPIIEVSNLFNSSKSQIFNQPRPDSGFQLDATLWADTKTTPA